MNKYSRVTNKYARITNKYGRITKHFFIPISHYIGALRREEGPILAFNFLGTGLESVDKRTPYNPCQPMLTRGHL